MALQRKLTVTDFTGDADVTPEDVKAGVTYYGKDGRRVGADESPFGSIKKMNFTFQKSTTFPELKIETVYVKEIALSAGGNGEYGISGHTYDNSFSYNFEYVIDAKELIAIEWENIIFKTIDIKHISGTMTVDTKTKYALTRYPQLIMANIVFKGNRIMIFRRSTDEFSFNVYYV